MHGDLTPWNLRQLGDGRLVLFDWEEAGWGPPGADEVLYRATASVLRREPPGRLAAGEAAEFWQDRIRRKSGRRERDEKLATSLLAVLERIRLAAGDPITAG
jgi:aminoglycoside phosphotransferase (APT) family kinase protein